MAETEVEDEPEQSCDALARCEAAGFVTQTGHEIGGAAWAGPRLFKEARTKPAQRQKRARARKTRATLKLGKKAAIKIKRKRQAKLGKGDIPMPPGVTP